MQLTRSSRAIPRCVPLFLLFVLFHPTAGFATAFNVTSTADSGAGTLRAAITAANADAAAPHTITISIAGAGPHTISLLSALPAITRQTTITASGEAISGAPGVRLEREQNTAFSAPGLAFTGTADNSVVSWLSITGFTGYGIDIQTGADSVSVFNCYIGVPPDGVTDAGNSTSGIHIAGGSAVIGDSSATGNLISGNNQSGILVDTGASFSSIRGNRIGTNAAGTAALGNAQNGILAAGTTTDVSIGAPLPSVGNQISGNGTNGIFIGANNSLWRVRNNFIGTTADGSAALKNNGIGVSVSGDFNTIGGIDSNSRNVISANASHGISLNSGADGNTIRANYIGLNAAGTASLGDQDRGVNVDSSLAGCTIGGTAVGHRNVISGNLDRGIYTGVNVSGCTISGNYIGTNAAGDAAVANGHDGVELRGTTNVLGGATAGERNIISGNTFNGVTLFGTDNVVKGNYIGTNAAGTAAIGNGHDGVGTGAGGTIGGIAAGEGNVISGNVEFGIDNGGATTNLLIVGNYIGTNAAGTAAVPNARGLWLRATSNTVGGTTAAHRNVISGNTNDGMWISGTSNIVQGNYIGTNALGTAALGNGSAGIRAITAASVTIGGSVAGAGNVISGNASNGISMDGDTTNAVISGNRIGTNALGTAALANNGSGISLGGTGHVVGGTTAAARNVLSGNLFNGIALQGSGNTIRGNYIGTNAAGDGDIGNQSTGLRAITVTSGTIGGTAAGAGNVISGNDFGGITLDGDTSNLIITGNFVGLNAAGTAALPNDGSGISVGGQNHVVGGNTAAARNVISGNEQGGVVLRGENNTLLGNYIGTNPAGNGAIGNGGYGIRIYESTGGQVGGAAVADGNLVSGNGRGISLEQSSTGNVLRNNIIGLNAAMSAKIPNHGSGIEVFTNNNTIGAPGTPPDGNVIAGNAFQGIVLSSRATGNIFQGNWIGTNKTLSPGLGNTQVGVYSTDAFGNVFGGTTAGAPNTIAYNGFIGVFIERGDSNEFVRNSIFENGLLGIDIGDQGLIPNDNLDADIVGNKRQNFPLLTSVVTGPSTEVDGIIQNEPNTQYRVELFTSPNCDNTGMGEGKTWFSSLNVTTGPDGSGVIDASLQATADPYMSATVTDPEGNTSEFSPCAKTTGPNPGTIQFYRSAVLSYEGVLPTGKAVLTRSHGMAGTVTVNFTVSDNGDANSPTAGADYVDSDQVVTFLDGEVLKIIEIPLIVDPAIEDPDPEVGDLAITNPTGGALLGAQAISDFYIFDQRPDSPGLIVEDASVTEGNSGQKNLTFNVKLSPTDHDVTVAYLTEPGTAVEGQDYTYVEGTIDFTPSATTQTQTVNVPILGDTALEPDEVVWMRITGSGDGSNWIAFDVYGLGLIENDDSDVQPEEVFKDGFEDLPP